MANKKKELKTKEVGFTCLDCGAKMSFTKLTTTRMVTMLWHKNQMCKHLKEVKVK